MRSKWIAKILEFDLEIKPTKLIKGQGLAKLLAEANCQSLGVNFINECSGIQQGRLFDMDPQREPHWLNVLGIRMSYIFCKSCGLQTAYKETRENI